MVKSFSGQNVMGCIISSEGEFNVDFPFHAESKGSGLWLPNYMCSICYLITRVFKCVIL